MTDRISKRFAKILAEIEKDQNLWGQVGLRMEREIGYTTTAFDEMTRTMRDTEYDKFVMRCERLANALNGVPPTKRTVGTPLFFELEFGNEI